MPYSGAHRGLPFHVRSDRASGRARGKSREQLVHLWLDRRAGPWAAVWLPRNRPAMTMRLTGRGRLGMVRILLSGGNDGAGDSASVFFFRPIERQHSSTWRSRGGSRKSAVPAHRQERADRGSLRRRRGAIAAIVPPRARPGLLAGAFGGGGSREPAFDERALVTGGGEGIDQLRTDGVTARANAWSHGGDHIRGMSADLTLHRVERGDRAAGGAAPAGMNRPPPPRSPNRPSAAARSRRRERQPRCRTRSRRTRRPPARAGESQRRDDRNGRTVHLSQRRHVLDAERGGQLARSPPPRRATAALWKRCGARPSSGRHRSAAPHGASVQ